MGNQTSHSANNKNDQAHIKLLLDKWSTEEKKHLEQLLKDTAILDSQQVIQQCHDNLPTYFDKQLEQVFALYITQQGSTSPSNNNKPSTTITSRQFLDTLHSLIDGTTLQSGAFIQPSEAFLNLFTLANQHCQLSFKTFISLIVKVGIRLWFTDSGLKVDIFDKEEKKGQEDNAYQQQQARLVNTLLYSAGYLEQQKKQQDDMDWLEEDGDDDKKDSNNNKGKKKTALDIWAQQIDQQQPFQKDQDVNNSTFTSNFFSWYEQTKGFKLLFHLVVKCYYFGYERLGKSTMDQLHSLRIKHERSPSIQQQSFSNLFTPYDYFYLSLQLPQNALSWSAIEKTQRKIKNNDDVTHQLIYSSRHHGNSWQRFVQSIGQQGATLLVIKTKNDGAVFGGYTDEPWQLMTDWYGSSLNFLYQLSGHYTPWNMFGVWNATSINDHYQYLCWGKKSLPNGLGMGGQFEYSGLWINADFIHGHSRGGPYCSTYQSPRLTKMDPFEIDEVEVWLVRPLLRDEEEELNGESILNRNEDMEFLEMAGRKLYSRDLEAPINDDEEDDNNDTNNDNSNSNDNNNNNSKNK